MRTSRMKSPPVERRSKRPPDLDDLEPVGAPGAPGDTDSLRRRCQSPRFHRIQVLVDEEIQSPAGSPLSSRRSRSSSASARKPGSQSRDPTPDPPTYTDVITGSPSITGDPIFDFPSPKIARPGAKVQVFRKTEVYEITNENAVDPNEGFVENGVMDLNSNFADRPSDVTSLPSLTSADGMRKCPGGDHDHRLCRQQLDDLHAQLLGMMSDATDGSSETMESSVTTVNNNVNVHNVLNVVDMESYSTRSGQYSTQSDQYSTQGVQYSTQGGQYPSSGGQFVGGQYPQDSVSMSSVSVQSSQPFDPNSGTSYTTHSYPPDSVMRSGSDSPYQQDSLTRNSRSKHYQTNIIETHTSTTGSVSTPPQDRRNLQYSSSSASTPPQERSRFNSSVSSVQERVGRDFTSSVSSPPPDRSGKFASPSQISSTQSTPQQDRRNQQTDVILNRESVRQVHSSQTGPTSTSSVTFANGHGDAPEGPGGRRGSGFGPCNCCPYGYHIDLTFLGIFDEKNDNDHLERLIQIRKHKKKLRKSMEIYLQNHENGEDETDQGESLMTMMEEDEEATRAMLNEIDSSVDATIASIDHLILAGREPRKFAPDFDESIVSVSSGPQNTSSPKPNGAGLRDSNESLSSLDTSMASDTNARAVERSETRISNAVTTITSHQIAVNMANCFDTIRSESSENMISVTPDQLHKMREQIALSLQKMKDLEDQVKAIPVLQVRISVLKEEKRLLELQNQAKSKRLSQMYRSIGVGDHTIDEPEKPRTRSRSQSPGFEMSDFASYRRGKRTSLPGDKPNTAEQGTGGGDVDSIYYLQPDLVSQEEFIENARDLLPEHIKQKVNEDPVDEDFISRTFGTTDRNSPFLLPSVESPDTEFERIEKALEQDSAARFFSKPGDKPRHPEPTSDSDESTTTVTTTKITKIFETSDFAVPERVTKVSHIPEIGKYRKPLTRDFGQNYNEVKPAMVDECIGVDEASDAESDYDEYGRKIVTTTTVTRKNLLLQEERVKMALREALHRDVKSVGINVKFSTSDKQTLTDFITTNDVGCSNDTIDVTVKPTVWLRSMGTEVKPSTINHATWTDRQLTSDSGTNTPTVSLKSKTTNTNKLLTFPAATNTEGVSTYSVGVETDRKSLIAMNLINDRSVNTEGLCTCGPNQDELIVADEVERVDAAPGDEDDDGTTTRTTTTTRRRIVSEFTSPISVSVNRDYRTNFSTKSAPTSPTFKSRSMTDIDTGIETESQLNRSWEHEDRLKRIELERSRLTTYDRYFPPTVRTQKFTSSLNRPRIGGPPGDSLLVKRVRSYGHNLPYYSRTPQDYAQYSDHTNDGTYLSTVSSNRTLDVGPGSEPTDRRGKTVTAHGYSGVDSWRGGRVKIERTERSQSASSTESQPEFVDVVDQGAVMRVQDQSLADIFGNQTTSTMVRKSEESSSTTTVQDDGSLSLDSSPKRKSRRAKLDTGSMLSSPGDGGMGVPGLTGPIGGATRPSALPGPRGSTRSVGAPGSPGGAIDGSPSRMGTRRKISGEVMSEVMIVPVHAEKEPSPVKEILGTLDNRSSDLSIPLHSNAQSGVTVTSSMTSSVLTLTSSKSIGPDGSVIENIGADSDFSSTDPNAKRPDVDLKSEVDRISSSDILLDSIACMGDSGPVLSGALGTGFGAQGSSSIQSSDSTTTSQSVITSDNSSSRSGSLSPARVTSSPTRSWSRDLNRLTRAGNRSGNVTVTSSVTSSSTTFSSSKTLGPDGKVIENIHADSDFSSTDPNAKRPEVDLETEVDKFSSGLASLSAMDGSEMTVKSSAGTMLSSSSGSGLFQGSFKSSVRSGESTSGVKEYASSREIHSVGGQGTIKEETMKKEDGQVVEHSVKTDEFSGDTASVSGSIGKISIGKAAVVKPVVKPNTSIRFLRTKSESPEPAGPSGSTSFGSAGSPSDDYLKSKESTMTMSSGYSTSSSGPMGQSMGLQLSSPESSRSGIRTLASDKTLADFKQESAKLKSRLLKTEAVLGDFSATTAVGESLTFSGGRKVVPGTVETMVAVESTSTPEGAVTTTSKAKKVDGVTVESSVDTKTSGKTSPGKSSPKQPKSIMKKGTRKDRHEKKAIKFAAGTVGGKQILKKRYVSTSSASDSDSDTSDTSTGSESSFDEGSYDGREGKITYQCQDEMSKAKNTVAQAQAAGRDSFEMSPTSLRACESVNDHLLGKKDVPTEIWNESLSSLHEEWFRVSGQRLTNPQHVEAYITVLRGFSTELLEKILNLVDTNGNTCLHYAVSYCNFETLSLLLDTGVCDVNKTNKAGYTPIMLASLAQVQMDRQKEILRYLFREGNVNMKATQAGQTALMLAVSHGRKEMVKLLLDCGADINAQDDDGSTALMCACEHGHGDIVKVLLAQPECNATLVDNDGSTALSIAMESDHRDIAVLLYAKLGIKKSGSPIS